MPVCVRVSMVVVVVAMLMHMAVSVPVASATLTVGPLNRMEGRHDVCDCRAQTFEHDLDDMVAQNQDSVREEGGRQVTIADVPGQLDEMQRISRGDAVKRFIGGLDIDAGVVLEQQLVTGCENDRLRLVQ